MGILMKNGVSYTGSMLGGSTKTFKSVLEAGETSISFVDTLITGNSTIDYETSKLGVNPTNIEVANNAVTLTFAAQAEDIGIKVTISNDAAEPAPAFTTMRFLKSTGASRIALPIDIQSKGPNLSLDFYINTSLLNGSAIFGSQWASAFLMTFNNSNGNLCWEHGGAQSTIGTVQNKIYHVNVDWNKITANELAVTSSPSGNSGTSDKLYLFCGESNGHNAACILGRMKIYEYDNLIMDLLPTKIGGEACYYDLIGKKPYFSYTSTPLELVEFAYDEPTPCISVGGSQQILHLPMTFTTGNENYILKSKMYFSSNHATTVNDYSYFVTAWNGGTNMIANDYGGYISVYPTGGRNLISMNGIKDRWIDIEINQAQNYVKIDGVIYNNTWRNDNTQFYIQGGNTGAPVFYGEIQVYQNGTLIANYIPSVKANGIGYFYDTVSQTDKVSEGNSSFGYACF